MGNKIIACYYQILEFNDKSDWTLAMPIYAGIILFFVNSFYNKYLNRKKEHERVSNRLIEITDKMMRYIIDSEYSAIDYRYYIAMGKIKDIDRDKSELYKYEFYYHNKSEKTAFEYDLLRSELKGLTRDFNKYFNNENNKLKILSILSEAALYTPDQYSNLFAGRTFENIGDLDKARKKELDKVVPEIIFNTIGFELIKIQKLIDPKSPTLYLSKELEEKLMTKLKEHKP